MHKKQPKMMFEDGHSIVESTLADPESQQSLVSRTRSRQTHRHRMCVRPRNVVRCLVLLACGSILVLMPVIGYLWWLQVRVKVSLEPTSMHRQAEETIIATTMPENSSESQTQVLRVTQTLPITINATGTVFQQAMPARGIVTWYNLNASAVTLPAGTLVTISSHLSIVTDTAVTIPAGQPPALGETAGPAHALQTGPQGNVPAHAIHTLCQCGGANVSVTNLAAFANGKNATTAPVLQQTDVDHTLAPVRPTLLQQLQQRLRARLAPAEKFLTPATCSTQSETVPPVGSLASHARTMFTATCAAQVYNLQDVRQKAITLFLTHFHPSASLVLLHIWTTQTAAVRLAQRYGVSIQVTGVWMYHLAPTLLQELPAQLAHLMPDQATRLLLHLPGVQRVSLQSFPDWLPLPNTPAHITVALVPAPPA